MIIAMKGELKTTRMLIKKAREVLTEEEYELFVNVKTHASYGGNTALLYACNASNGDDNFMLVKYLLEEAGANPNIMSDSKKNALILAVKRN